MNEEMCAVHFLLECFRMASALLFLGHDILHIGHCIGRNGGRAGVLDGAEHTCKGEVHGTQHSEAHWDFYDHDCYRP